MRNIADIPSPPLTLSTETTDLIGAHIKCKLINGEKVNGSLFEVNGPQQFILLRKTNDNVAHKISFQKLRVMQFTDVTLTVNSDYPFTHDGSNIVLTSHKQDYEIFFNDGAHQKGKTCGWVIDDYALHLFPNLNENTCVRIFIPICTVKSYSIGPFTHELKHGQHEYENEQIDIASNSKELTNVLEHRHQINAAFGKILVEEKVITSDQLHQALLLQQHKPNKKLGDILEEQNLITSSELHQALAMQLGLPFIHLRDFDIDQNILGMLSHDFARGHMVMPLMRHNNHLVIAIANPANNEVINLLRFTTGDNVEVVVATENDITWAIDHYYGDYDTNQAMEELDQLKDSEVSQQLKIHELEKLATEKPTVRLVNYIINDAINRHASDIHIRANKGHIQLYFRIDGTLVPIRRLDKTFLPAIISRIKILGHMDITERRLPQDGRTHFSSHGKRVDLRISIMPTINGETAIIRVLDLDYSLRDISEVGLTKDDQQILEDLLHLSYGMILVTGPTGSGKSTTLYAAINNIVKQNVNIITVEDPVEYHIDGIEQVQINPVTGYTFAKALRHILRHDPDVIMIGEIRDQETAKIAVESSLTGHLVLSTLHTNSAAGTITRLLEMGIEPYLLNSTLLAVLAQRLVRINCPYCKTEEPLNDSIRKSLGVTTDETFYHSTGCKECNHTGYANRAAVYELLTVSPSISKLIDSNVTIENINQQAIENGMTPLTQNALQLARDGTISLQEVYRVRLE